MRGHIFSWFQRWAGYVDPRWKREEELLINALQRRERGNQNEGEKDQVKGAGIQRGSLAVGKHQGEQSTTLCRSNGEEGTSRADRLGKNSSRWLCSGQCNALLLPCQTVFRENCIPHSSFYLFIYFQLRDNCFTVLHWFLPNTNMTSLIFWCWRILSREWEEVLCSISTLIKGENRLCMTTGCQHTCNFKMFIRG